MMSKGSDINVGSIEEDIEILNSLLTFKGKGLEYALEKKSIKAIENILQDYTRQKQINEEHQKINGELREKVKELIKEKQELTSALLDSVPKEKVKDMFEEAQTLYEKKLKEIDFKELKNISLNIFEGIKLEVERDLLRRLLQESEDK